MNEKAISFVMNFYNVSREIALKYYSDEIECAQNLLSKGIVNERPSNPENT